MSPRRQQGLTWALSPTHGECWPKERFLGCRRGHVPWHCSGGNAEWPCSRGSTAGSAVTAAHAHKLTPTPGYTHTQAALQRQKLHFCASQREIFQDSVAILWHGRSITNRTFLRVKKGKMKTDQQYNLLQCISISFSWSMWALAVQYQSNDILVLCNLLGKTHSGIATSFIKTRIL